MDGRDGKDSHGNDWRGLSEHMCDLMILMIWFIMTATYVLLSLKMSVVIITWMLTRMFIYKSETRNYADSAA